MFDQAPTKGANISFVMIRILQIFIAAIFAVLTASCNATKQANAPASQNIAKTTTTDNITGYWTIPDPDTKKPDAIVIGYKKDGVYYYRMVAVYDDSGRLTDTIANCTQRAKGITGNPKMCDFDMIWGLKFDGKKYSNGHIIDPDSGKIYNCQVWYNEATQNLIVRGELWIFGENMDWHKPESIPESAKVNPSKLSPKIFEK